MEGAGGGLPEDVLDQRALARSADTPVTTVTTPSGNSNINVFQVVLPGARITMAGISLAAAAGLGLVGTGMAAFPLRY